jgi:hypothetical protein
MRQYHHAGLVEPAMVAAGKNRNANAEAAPAIYEPVALTITDGCRDCQTIRPFLLDQSGLCLYNGIELMFNRRLVWCVAASLLCAFLLVRASSLDAAASTMPVSEIRAGMVGIGRTVFEGTRVDEFTVHILGVIENVMGPRRTLILSRLEGGPLAETGVIAGMSGSPVYIDGRLIGAVSYSMGAFPKEPIAGITPIDEMLADAAIESPRANAARVQVELPLSRENLTAAFRKALAWNRPFAASPDDATLVGVSTLPGLNGVDVGTMLRPIATPLVVGGFSGGFDGLLGEPFRQAGFIPTAAVSPAQQPDETRSTRPLEPGDALGVNFVTGDFLLGATGTVTEVDGDRVYAFGHPMYNLGPTEFPMTRAYVYTLLPSLSSSTKLASTGETIGTLLHDRPTTIAGRLGPGPRMIPVSVALTSDHAPARTFHFNVVRDQLFTPLMTSSVLANLFAAYERQFGASTFTVQGSVAVGGHGSIALDNLFSGDDAASGASSSIIGPLTALVGNDYEPVDIEEVKLSIDSIEEDRTATLERVWIDDPRPRPGRTVPLKVLLRPHRGDDIIRTLNIEIPANASGSLSLLVTDGARLTQTEQREARLPQPRSVPQLLRALNRERRNDRLYVRLLSAQPGAVVNGELLASLPPSVLTVIEADRSTGGASALSSAAIREWEISTGLDVTGSRTLTVPLSSN